MTHPELDPTGPASGGAPPAQPWGTSRRRFLSLSGLAMGGALIGVGATGCGTAQTGNSTGDGGAAKGRPGASGDTFFVAGFQWGPPTNFNPLGATPQWPTAGRQIQLIYESLVRFNLIDGSFSPGLGKEIQDTDDTTLTVPLQEGTKFSDGSELTADDVVFTFEIAKDISVSYSSVWTYLDSVTASDPRTVVFKIKTKPYNPGSVKDAIANVYILPKAIWSTIGNDKISSRDEPQAGRQRALPDGQGRPDPGRPQAQRRLLGQGGLRHPGAAGDRAPHLQEQQRRRPQAGQR